FKNDDRQEGARLRTTRLHHLVLMGHAMSANGPKQTLTSQWTRRQPKLDDAAMSERKRERGHA
ncbi:MAG: hypothetical protein WCB55_20820, partial [Pseudolabrys sp.]